MADVPMDFMAERMRNAAPPEDEGGSRNPCTVTQCVFNQDGVTCTLDPGDVPVEMVATEDGQEYPVCKAYAPREELGGEEEMGGGEMMGMGEEMGGGEMMGMGGMMMPEMPMSATRPQRRRVPPPPPTY